jgi:hypothetical protein
MSLRLCGLPLTLIASLSLSGCVESLRSQPSSKWTTGFWYWHGYSAEAALAKEAPDVLFLHAGTISKYSQRNVPARWFVSQELPDFPPAAREYWLVFRNEEPVVPDLSAAPMLGLQVSRLQKAARQRHLKVVGIQLDIDSPTGDLKRYASFIRAVRKELPQGLEISVTALLDWFRDGTYIADVIRESDEFVPQFYDVAPPGSGDFRAIAAKIDAVQWAPKLNRYGKRFRIGISTFGRTRFERKAHPSSGYSGIELIGDLTPLDVASNPAFNLRTSRSEANELILSYRPSRKVRIGYTDVQPGDLIQFVLSTPDSVRTAVESARRMRGYCAGVVFFRWPAANESLVMQPDDTLMAAGLAPRELKAAGIEVVSGQCAAVSCLDLYLVNASTFSPEPVRYRIRSSAQLEYFLPEEKIPVRMTGPSEIELKLPAYCGRSRMLLGRAVSVAPAAFRVEEEQ